MTTLATMRTRIDNELVRGGTLNSEIDQAIRSAIEHYKWTRFWFNEGTFSSSTVNGQEYYSAPATFLSLDALRLNETGTGNVWPITPASYDQIEEWTGATAANDGKPIHYAEYKDQYRLYPVPDGVYALLWSGLYDLGAPTLDADTSAWLTHAEPLIRARARALVRIEILRDERAEAEAASPIVMQVGCVSLLEASALKALMRHTVRKTTSGRIQARDF